MTTKLTIYAAVVAAALVFAGVAAILSDRNAGRLESAAAEAKQNAVIAEDKARSLEQQAAAYKEKINFLENSLSEIEKTARRQDEEIKRLSEDTNAARDGARHARSVRSITSTSAELCARLAELGHPCGG